MESEKYEKIKESGWPKKGGQGQVWKAKQKADGKIIALKEVKYEGEDEKEKQEGKAALIT